MMTWEEIGRTAWIGYLVLATALLLPSVLLLVGGFMMLGREDTGPVEVEPVSLLLRVLTIGSVGLFPLAWGFGAFFAHRLNEGRRAMVPFLVNLVPVGGMGVSASAGLWGLNEGGGLWWLVIYGWILVALLLTGLTTVWRTTSR